jgi:hypothetical protein
VGRGCPVDSHLGVAVAGANRNDHLLLEQTLDGAPIGSPMPLAEVEQGLWLDKGYDFDAVHGLVRQHGYVPHIVPRDTEREWLDRLPG